MREPDAAALDIIRRGAERVVEVSDEEIAAAIRILFSDTHAAAEGVAIASREDVEDDRGPATLSLLPPGRGQDEPPLQPVGGGRNSFLLVTDELGELSRAHRARGEHGLGSVALDG